MTHVVLAADAGYLPYVPCLLAQIARHGPSCEGVVLAVPPEIDATMREGIGRTSADLGTSIEIVEVGGVDGLAPPRAIRRGDHVSAFTFAKLLLPTALPDHDQVLYLDIDVLVRDSLGPLLDWELEHPIAAVHEIGDGAVHLFGSTRVPYFNAGVLRMSLGAMREMDVLGSARGILRRRPDLPFHDQDVLNLLFRGRHDALPLAFNMFEPVASAGLPSWQVVADPVIVHFVGPDKPWLDGYESRFTREWRNAEARAVAGSLGPSAQVGRARYSTTPRLAGAIAATRGSAVGRRLRSALPDRAKGAVSRGLLRLLPGGRVSRAVRTGLAAEVEPDPSDPST